LNYRPALCRRGANAPYCRCTTGPNGVRQKTPPRNPDMKSGLPLSSKGRWASGPC